VGEAVDVNEVERTIIRVPSSSIQLPSTIFETEGVELKVGLLNQAAPRNELLPEIDPDIAAALDGEFEEEEDLEDDFFAKATGADDGMELEVNRVTDDTNHRNDVLARFGLVRNSKQNALGSDDDESEGNEYEEKDGEECTDQDDRRSRFTNYSMSSAMIKRPDGLQIIDEHFEALYEEYDEEKMGDIEEKREGINGFVEPDSERFQQLVDDEYSRLKRKYVIDRPAEAVKASILAAMNSDGEVEQTKDMVDILVDTPGSKKARWDCESVISMGSNIFNHPTLIKEPSKRAARAAAQSEDIGASDDQTMMEEDTVSVTSSLASTFRPKNETAEERRLRKQAVKQCRRERRVEKKSMQEYFKDNKKEMDVQRSKISSGKIRTIK